MISLMTVYDIVNVIIPVRSRIIGITRKIILLKNHRIDALDPFDRRPAKFDCLAQVSPYRINLLIH